MPDRFVDKKQQVTKSGTGGERVTLLDGTLEIQGIKTMTSVSVTNKVALAMAEVPRQGVKTLRSGDTFIPVK